MLCFYKQSLMQRNMPHACSQAVLMLCWGLMVSSWIGDCQGSHDTVVCLTGCLHAVLC
jgi:hypothetical protein